MGGVKVSGLAFRAGEKGKARVLVSNERFQKLLSYKNKLVPSLGREVIFHIFSCRYRQGGGGSFEYFQTIQILINPEKKLRKHFVELNFKKFNQQIVCTS